MVEFWPQGVQPGGFAAVAVLVCYGTFLQKLVARRVRQARAGQSRDLAMAWTVGGAVSLGTGLWLQSLMALLLLPLELDLSVVLPLLASAWLPAVFTCGLGLWFLVSPTWRRGWALGLLALVVLGVGLVPWLMASAVMISPMPQWQHAGLWTGWLAMGLGEVLALNTLRDPHSPTIVPHRVVLAMAERVLLRGGGLLILYGALQWPERAQTLTEVVLSPSLLLPLLMVVGLLIEALVHLSGWLDHTHQQQRQQLSVSLAQARDDLLEVVHRDPLTQLLNRAGFKHELTQRIQTHPRAMAVMLLNLDGFQKLEDQWGHAASLNLLRQVGARLRTIVRHDDAVARDERDQFLVLFSQAGDLPAIGQLAQRLNELLAQPCQVDDIDISLTASIGVALYPDDVETDRLIEHAEEAMVMARKAGGAAHCLFQVGMHREVEQQILLQRDLRHAIARGELELHYQPKLDASHGALVGVEALLRWRHPERGMVPPGVFIPVAERFGLIAELGEWVLVAACRQIRDWLEQGLRIPVAVNVSVHQLRQSDLEARVRQALHKHAVPADMVLLEITETVAMENVDFSLAVFDLLAGIGVQLSIDDFGTGYSSLSYLRRLPARQLKVDRSFVHDLESETPDAMAIVEAVVRLAHALGLKVVAEGVETARQAELLRYLGCDELQGYLLGRPMPESELRHWLAKYGHGHPLLVDVGDEPAHRADRRMPPEPPSATAGGLALPLPTPVAASTLAPVVSLARQASGPTGGGAGSR